VTYLVTAGLPVGATPVVTGNLISIVTTSGVAPGTYSLTIQGTDGSKTHTVAATLVVAAPDFSLSVSPASQSVAPGGTTGNYTVTATALNGWTGTVTYLVTAGLPTNATASVNGNLITIGTTGSVTPGSYTFTIQGTDGTRTHTVSATLVVTAPSFTLSVSPASNTVSRPTGSATATATYTVTVTPSGGFNGMVNLTATGGSTGVTLSLNPASVTVSGSNVTSVLTATVTSSAKKGNQKLTITGKGGGITATANASLMIN